LLPGSETAAKAAPEKVAKVRLGREGGGGDSEIRKVKQWKQTREKKSQILEKSDWRK
jgi:hypothetical protein